MPVTPTVLQIKLKEYGSELIEVADNGSGIAEQDYQALTLKYHTSKISQMSDLEVCCGSGQLAEPPRGSQACAIQQRCLVIAGPVQLWLPRGGSELPVRRLRGVCDHAERGQPDWYQAVVQSCWRADCHRGGSALQGDDCGCEGAVQAPARALQGASGPACRHAPGMRHMHAYQRPAC